MNPLRALFVSLSRIPPIVLIAVVLIIGFIVAMSVQGTLTSTEEKSKKEAEALKAKYEQKTKVVYSSKDITEGATIAADSLEEKEILQTQAPPDAFSSSSQIVGRIAKSGITAGSIVSNRDLLPIGGSASTSSTSLGFEGKIKPGFRAVTFAVDSNSGVAGFINPGSFVDIIATAGTGATTKAQPILSDVEVIAVGQTYQKSSGAAAPTQASSVTVGVSPEDAGKLIKGIMAGKLYLTLRNQKDNTPVAVVDVTSLFDKPASDHHDVASLPPPSALPPPPLPGAPSGGSSAAPPPPPPLHEIEIWTGSKKETLTVPKN